ncbi:Doubled CXXCH motif [Stieleria neptunia]|uniref:Doubled CXXCH motif n=1 Tax=Stieleria neptunia TaxID=2527979 RepID=A0A518HTL1_9BACT|nr:cytochrome c3 family protein [Stieleria neptunia]QDV44182.1 Doubled CXXCH motif [Stieleria neptunia]
MRRDNLEIPQPPANDRPGDWWMPAVDATGSTGDARVRTWSGRRRRWTVVFMICVALGGLAMLAMMPPDQLLKPGELSTPHAQILAGAVAGDKCGACHHQAALSLTAWFRSASGSHAGVRQSDLCVDCHHRTIDANLAFAAHNLPLSVRDQMTETVRLASQRSTAGSTGLLARLIPDAAVDQNDVACRTCHQEHHGADGDLLSVSNNQCQSCHSKRFGGFADSHPDWNGWPYGRGGELSFNHATHQQTHFPSWKSGAEKFDCSICHPAGPTGELVRVASYETGCQACHDDAMNVQAGKGIDLIALPSLPPSVLTDVSDWPEGATGFADGVISPLAELMLRGDPTVSGIVRVVPGADVSRLSIEDPQANQTLARLANGYQTLIDDVARRGQAAIQERLLQQGISPGPFRPVLRSLPPQLIESAGKNWFTRTNRIGPQNATIARPQAKIRLVLADEDDLLEDDLLGSSLLGDPGDDDLLVEDPLLEDPLQQDPLADSAERSSTGVSAVSPSELVRVGGWYRDDQRMAVSYRGNGHADPVMAGMIETFAQLGEHDPLKQRFFAASVVAACVSCHPAATAIPATWRAERQVGRRSEFTKFSHRPHLSVSALGDCSHCHQVRDRRTMPDHEFVFAGSEFKALGRESCAACHHTNAAGEACTQCHRYHISDGGLR